MEDVRVRILAQTVHNRKRATAPTLVHACPRLPAPPRNATPRHAKPRPVTPRHALQLFSMRREPPLAVVGR